MKRSRVGLGNTAFHNLKEDIILGWFLTSHPHSTHISQVEQSLHFFSSSKKLVLCSSYTEYQP